MKLGLSSYTYTWAIGIPGHSPKQPLSPTDLLQQVATLDVRLLQIADNMPLHQLSATELETFKQATIHYNIDIEVGTRGVEPAHLHTYLRLAQALNSPLVRVVIDTPTHEPPLPEVITLLKESLPCIC